MAGIHADASPEYARLSAARLKFLSEDRPGRRRPTGWVNPHAAELQAAYKACEEAHAAKANGTYTPNPNGTVYVVAAGDFVKIGFTEGSLKRRLRALQNAQPVKLVVLAEIKATMRDEKALHVRFAAQRAEGEWFRREGALADWIERGCKE